MRTEFVTKGFSKTEAMEEFLETHAIATVDSMLKREKDVHLRVVVDEDSHRNQGRKPHFVVEIILKSGASRKMLKVRKAAGDYKKALIDATRALKALLRKRSEKRHDRKYVDQRRFVEPIPESQWAG